MPLKEDEVTEAVLAFIRENFLYMRPDFELRPDDRLLERGIIDSLGVVEVLHFVEERYGVQPSDEDITEANFGSLSAIARYVLSKTPGAPTRH
jgi:acyl carrier protein